MKELQHSLIILQKFFLTCCKVEFAFYFCLSIWVFFHEYLNLQGSRCKGKEAISLYPFYHFHSLHGYLVISRVIAAESFVFLTQVTNH